MIIIVRGRFQTDIDLAQTAADKKDAEQNETNPQKQHFQRRGCHLTGFGNLRHALRQYEEDADAGRCQGHTPDYLHDVWLTIHPDVPIRWRLKEGRV